MRSTKGGGGTVQLWPSSPDNNPTLEEGSLTIQRHPPTGGGISPPERHTGPKASVGRHGAGHLHEKHAVLHRDAQIDKSKIIVAHDVQMDLLTSAAEVFCRVFTRQGNSWWNFAEQLHDLGYMV